MKIKLNVSKDLKRALKFKAIEKELERTEYVYEIIETFMKEKESLWISKIEERIESLAQEEISVELKARENMRKTIKKQQPIILNVNERVYFALELIAEDLETSIDEMLVNLLVSVS